jgi:hypothetical protein
MTTTGKLFDMIALTLVSMNSGLVISISTPIADITAAARRAIVLKNAQRGRSTIASFSSPLPFPSHFFFLLVCIFLSSFS